MFQKFGVKDMYMKGVNINMSNSTRIATQLGEEGLFMSFEPKIRPRFIVRITDKKGEYVIPAWVIKGVTRPRAKYIAGDFKWIWMPMTIRTYDPIVPSMSQKFYEYIMDPKTEPFNVELIVLGPVGDEVEKWQIKNAYFSEVDFGKLSWDDTGAMEIEATISYPEAELLF